MKNSIFLVRAANSVIPEGAKRLSGIQKKGGYWTTGSRLRLVRYDDCLLSAAKQERGEIFCN
jgi:hypothetical protein